MDMDWVQRKQRRGIELKTSLQFLIITILFISVVPKAGTMPDTA